MDEVIFAEVTAKVSIDFLTVISATIEQHENVFYNVELKSGAKCIQESVGGTWVLRGDLDSINRAYNLMSTIYNLSQLDLMSNEVRHGAPGTPSFNHSSEYLEVVRYAANTPVVPSLQDDTDDLRSSDETSVIGGPSSEDVTVAVVNDDVSDRDDLCQRDMSGDEPVCQPRSPSPSQPDDGCKNRRKRGLPRKAIMSRLPKKVTLLLSAKDLGCEKRCLRPRKPLTIENLEGKDFEADNQKLVKTKTFKRRRDVKKQRHIEDVIKRINRSKMRSYSNSDFSNRSSHRYENFKTTANALSKNAGSIDRDAHKNSADRSVAQFTNYKCPDCGKIFSSLSNLYRHQKVSHSGLRYSCASCGKKFTCRISLQRHERVVHEGLRCNTCQRIFASELMKMEHRCPGSHREKSVTCQICGSSFSCTSNLNKHVRLLHADNMTDELSGAVSRQACQFCPRRFESAEELVNHAHSVHSACSKCGETLLPDLNLSEHLAVCSGAFNNGSMTKLQTKHKLRKMIDQPKSRQPINCLHCDKVFSTSSNLRKHIRVIHDNMRFECNVCSRAYACKEQLAQHVVKVHQGLMYRCDLCQEEFKNRLRLAKHQKLIHSHLVVESSYQCEKCGKQFLYKNNLQRHRKHDHEGLRYACRTCEQFFKSRQQAKQHDLVMHQGKKYACLQCAKVFSNLYKLREHETSAHTDLRPHQCAICGQQFARHSALSYHLQKKHDRSVNVAGELVPQPIPKASSSSAQVLLDVIPASDLAPQAGEIVPHLALDSKADPDSRSASSNSKEHNTQVFLEMSVPRSHTSTPVSSPAPLITVSPLVYASAPQNLTSSPIACESQKPIDMSHPIVVLDVAQELTEGQGLNMPSSQGVRMGIPDMLTYSSPVDVDNNQNPLLALSDSFSFYDSFSYSPLQSIAHQQGQDLSFFHPSSSTY